jgi:hypothetical protein
MKIQRTLNNILYCGNVLKVKIYNILNSRNKDDHPIVRQIIIHNTIDVNTWGLKSTKFPTINNGDEMCQALNEYIMHGHHTRDNMNISE